MKRGSQFLPLQLFPPSPPLLKHQVFRQSVTAALPVAPANVPLTAPRAAAHLIAATAAALLTAAPSKQKAARIIG